jgi:3-oxoacyl-[acyl-carrier protein] reductase
MSLNGKVALVTGGSGDIGRGIAQALADAGADVAITYATNIERANTVVAKLKTMGQRAVAVHLDQRDPESVAACAKSVGDEFGRVDILVNNAAWNIGIPFPDLDALDADLWDRIMETNLRGPYLLVRALAPMLKANDLGHIVNISSIGGIGPASSSVAYSASKAGLIHLTRCLAVAMAPNVAVNCIAPGLVENTRMAANVPEAIVAMAKREAVLGRVGQIDDIARQVLTFVTSNSISGQVMTVDGGMPGLMQ